MKYLVSSFILSSFFYSTVKCDLLWPTVADIKFSNVCSTIAIPSLQFSIVGSNSDILTDSISRYTSIFGITVPSVSPFNCSSFSSTIITNIIINITDSTTVLKLNTSEAYSISIPTSDTNLDSITITADTVFGALRSLETISQLLDYIRVTNTWQIPNCLINDVPVFHHRGLMMDTARHFYKLTTIYAMIDALAYNKYNVFHWHIVDDQAFSYVSPKFPSLSEQGAWGAGNSVYVDEHTYSPSDVQSVINYARLRGIRVIPEYDTPGHSLSWNAIPGLLTQCYNTTTNQPIPNSFGPIDPTNPANYEFLQTFFTEIAQVFPDDYIHIGGDEVSYTCWQSNPNINAWMANNGIAPGDYEALESYYVQKVLNIISSLQKEYIGWEEIFDNGLTLSPNTVIDVWKYHSTTAVSDVKNSYSSMDRRKYHSNSAGTNMTWQNELYNVTKAGYHAILSSPYYLNYISYGQDWTPYLTANPLEFGGSAEQQALVLGGEVSFWSEYIDSTNILSRSWPRASAVAQGLWSNPGASANITDATLRMQAHSCRLINRNIASEPASGPSYCPQEWDIQYNPPWNK